MNNSSILVVDDDSTLREAIAEALALEGYQVATASDSEVAHRFIDKEQPDMVISDLKMPGGSGLDLLRKCREKNTNLPFLLMSAYGEVDDAVSAMREGAIDFITKPFDLDFLENIVGKVMHREIADQACGRQFGNISTNDEIDEVISFNGMVEPKDPAMKNLYEVAGRVAKTDVSVLITGETGTGKEVLAQYIHSKSNRNSGPFIALNCAAIPENLLESEIFGFEKGAFSGAIKAKPGKFELAHGGTLLLDEIGEMPAKLQAKLLRVLQDGLVDRVGSTKSIKVDVRIIASTHRDLAKWITDGKFREDLFYRLSAFPLQIPALKNRPCEIEPMSIGYLNNKGYEVSLSQEAIKKLQSFDYPGNIRQLHNILDRAFILSNDGIIEASSIIFDSINMFNTDNSIAGNIMSEIIPITMTPENVPTLAAMEKQLIKKALVAFKDNRTHTAEALGVSIRTLRNKLNEYKQEAES